MNNIADKENVQSLIATSITPNGGVAIQADGTETRSTISLDKRYEIIREQIRHEDGLINQRLNWLLVSQGFLIAAFTAIVTKDSQATPNLPTTLVVIVFALSIAGLALNIFSFRGLNEAYKSLKYLRDSWHEAKPPDNDKNGQKLFMSFPNITWEGNAITTASGSPMVITCIWCFVMEWMLLSRGYMSVTILTLIILVAVNGIALVVWMRDLTRESMT